MDDEQKVALDEITDDERLTYSKILGGLRKLEAELPEKCNEETAEEVGRILATARAAGKYANDLFQRIVEQADAKLKRQRLLWKPLGVQAKALAEKAKAMSDALIAEKLKKQEADERAARERVAAAQKAQAEAEALALAAETPEAQAELGKQADIAWAETKDAVSQLDKPGDTSVKLGKTTVYQVKRIDFEILDMGKFATAHPELVTVRKGDTQKALREATEGMVTLPEELPGWPGVRVFEKKGTGAR